ncbi:MAG: peptidase [Frankiales bacterium]|nr:peptidase [Frankiales bacterium]
MDFADLDASQAIPRLSGLALSPDGTRLVTSVATLDAKKQKWVTALWEVDATGQRPARRLTRSAKGEGSPVFTDAGDVLFTSSRHDPESTEDDEQAALWLLPAAGGEARSVGTRPGGIARPRTAGEVVVVTSDTLPGSSDGEDDAARRKARKDRNVSAIVHRGYPVRFWDRDLGPGAPRLLVGSVAQDDQISWTDLTPTPERALDDTSYDLTPDGSQVVVTWTVSEPRGSRRTTLVVVDAGTGSRRVLADHQGYEYGDPTVSPDGTRVACIRWTRSTPLDPGDCMLVVLDLDGESEQVVAGWDRWPTGLRWTPDGTALLVTADEGGRAPVFRVELADLSVTRLTTDDGAYSDLCVARDGAAVYALRAGYDGPPTPVRIDPQEPGVPVRLPSPAPALDLPGRLTEVSTSVPDGREVRAWLALPEGAGPHPLVLWIHGGPLSSWNSWSWRWCPWLLTARGYAVLLPDPALSTGYGLEHVARGWGDWGSAPYEDLMHITDAALERPDLDASRTAAMGGSFGGYMANWVAGHTGRFQAIVTHASLWALDHFGATTDVAWYWAREMTPEMVAKNDPSQFADNIATPMLVVHGDKDYRVPIGEGLRLWWDLCSRAEDPQGMPHEFLYFPDENHWVLTPNHAVAWYEAVLAFLGRHILGRDTVLPDWLR